MLVVKSGVIFGITTKVAPVVVAHCPALGKKVYDFVVVLSSAGDHVPTIPLTDVVGNGEIASPEQIGLNGEKTGIIRSGVIVTVNSIGMAH
jgi:hypothetical protein